MLHFLRLHQRSLLLFLTVVIITSFVFFGTYGAFMKPPQKGDLQVYKKTDGKEISHEQMERFKKFLASDSEVIPSNSAFPNYLNTGFLHKEIITTQAIIEIALKEWEKVGPELEDKIKVEKLWSPYSHSESASVGAMNVWKIFAPAIPEELAKLKITEERTALLKTHFSLMSAERAFPEAYLTQILLWQQSKQADLSEEVQQHKGYLSLFGYKDVTDWMGLKLYESTIKSIIEVAVRAESEGIKVSDAEARKYLRTASEAGRQKAQVLKLDFLALKSPESFYGQQLQILHMSEEEAIETCRPLLLVQKLIAREAQERSSEEAIEKVKQEIASVDLYEMDAAWHFQKAEELYLFESYLENINRKSPELFDQTFQVEIREVSAQDIVLKDVWSFQLKEEGFRKLRARFPELAVVKTAEERAQILDSLQPVLRANIDNYTKGLIFKENPVIIDSLLEDATPRIIHLTLPLKGALKEPLKGLKESSLLYSKLKANESLKKISFNEETFYRIIPLQQEELRTLSFMESKKYLQPSLPKKCLSLVGNLIQEAKKAGFTKLPQESEGDFAARMRFLKNIQEHKNSLTTKNLLQKEREFVQPRDSWSLKKRTITGAEAVKLGCGMNKISWVQDHLLFMTVGEDKKEEILEKARNIVQEKNKQEAAFKFFKELKALGKERT